LAKGDVTQALIDKAQKDLGETIDVCLDPQKKKNPKITERIPKNF
jgi:hypothetical protein